jgi:hypothetical protein
MHPLRRLTLVFCGLKRVFYVDAFDDQHAIVRFFHFSADLGSQFSILGVNLARFQRASQRSHKSTGNRSHQIINGSGVRLTEVFGLDTVMGRDRSMNAEDHGLGFAREVRVAQRPFPPLDF